MNTQATMQSNQTERNTLGRSLPGALLATLKLPLNTMKKLSGLGSLAGSANLAAAALYPVANLSAPMYWDATSKRISDWKHSIRGEHSPCRQD